MRAAQITELSAKRVAELVRDGELSPVDTIEAALGRIEALNPRLNAFVHLCPERALEEAGHQAEALAGAKAAELPLAGVALGVKDMEDVEGLPTSYGSVPFAGRVAERDAVHVGRLRRAGAIVVGKTNTPEFGYTGFTKNRLFGTTRNPWDLERTPGGSSGGSAAAIASRMVPLATASDGGGSVRIPACYVGAFGMKPTFGRIPTCSPLGMQRWVDTVCYGPLTRTVEDAALYLDIASGYHPSDPDSLPPPARPYLETLDELPGPLRIAFSRDLGYAAVEPEIMREVESALAAFTSMGHSVEEIATVFPDLGRGWAYMCGAETHALVAAAVAGREDELGRSFWQGVKAASAITAADMGEIQRMRVELNRLLADIFDRYDLLLTPQLPTEAFAAAGPLVAEIDGRPLTNPLQAVAFTYPFNFSGHPAASLRAGFTDAGLPAGIQVVAERHRDDLVLQAARAYEQARPFDSWPEL